MASWRRPGWRSATMGRRSAIRHARADGIVRDMKAVQQATFVVDEAGFVASFPQRCGTAGTDVEIADVAAPEFLHEARDCL